MRLLYNKNNYWFVEFKSFFNSLRRKAHALLKIKALRDAIEEPFFV